MKINRLQGTLHVRSCCYDNNFLLAEGAGIFQTAPADNLEKLLEWRDVVRIGKEDLNDLLDDIGKEADLLVSAKPELLWYRHVRLQGKYYQS